FAVAVHPQDGAMAWFIPALADERRVPTDGALVVNRTRDGGASFETLRDGLPQTHCYDLVYRHGLAVAGDGRTLMMGSTTGGLWASADAGDSWQTVSMNLPPIYAVRFG
ncbi:MAG: exo-alpha-sialidase, partial [Piscinibacter sp.]|nr:exo-alpha-sialidase [Piscinibacter sp.]